MPRTILAAAVALAAAGLPGLRASSIEAGRIEPEKPTTDAPVVLVVEGVFPDSCPRIIAAAVVEETGDAAGRYTVTLEARGLEPPPPCRDVLTPFSWPVVLGFPRPGLPYSVDVVLAERGDPTAYPDLVSFRVEVGDRAGILGLTVRPDAPTDTQPVVLGVHGLLIGCGVDPRGLSAEVDLAGRRIRTRLEISIPPILCLIPQPHPYSGEAAIGPLPAGTYAVDVDLVEANGDEIVSTSYPDAGTVTVIAGISRGEFRRGDSNGDLAVDLADAIAVLEALFLGGGLPRCADAADADDSGALDLTDAVAILEYLFLGGKPPPAPGPDGVAGPDPTPDSLGCS